MKMKPMYPAIVNSPGTELAADVTATATEISVLSATRLPPAPNLLSLGSDDTAETVRYTQIDGTKLTVERGFQGVAKSWSAGTRVARYFTAYDHDTFIENIGEMDAETSAAEHAELTFAPGLQVVEFAHDMPFRLGEIRGRTEIHDDVGIVNVRNPYAIVTGANLLPPFTEWDARPGDVIVGPYKLSKTVTAQYQATISPKIRVIRGHTYTLSSTRNGRMVLGEYKEDGSVIGYPIAEVTDNNGFFSQSVTIGADTDYIIVQLSNVATSGTFSFENTILVPGTEPKPFTPQQRSIWAAECQLAANPVDGSNPDVLYVGDDGLPYVLGKWKKVALDGLLPWMHDASFTGHKRVRIIQYVPGGAASNPQFMTKYNGTTLKHDNTNDKPDCFDLQPSTGYLYLTIPNSDSGWGPDYTPSADEIKAYFFGWKIHVDGGSRVEPYNGAGPKAWYPITRINDQYEAQYLRKGDAPTTIAPNKETWQPYRLQYLKAKPTVEPVRNYELGATLSAGSNMVEVGSGIVLREKANPATNLDGWTYINTDYPGLESSRLNFKSKDFFGIFEGGSKSNGWTTNNIDAYGNVRAAIKEGYRPSAVYHVTYTMLDPTLEATISGAVAANLRGTVSDLVQHTGDMERRLSVVETQKAEKDVPPPQWIKPTLLSGWVEADKSTVEYFKDALGFVHIRGMVKSGAMGNPVFLLPKEYRPKQLLETITVSKTNDAVIFNNIEITPEGKIIPYIGGDNWLSLDNIKPFLAER
ncbi:hypothetical protein [Paenibacillus apiarius]|uniref:hypothetical protein n=1 Tax=Paenibacillus apiarius TaxID=46240 RepID=UPI003B3BA073